MRTLKVFSTYQYTALVWYCHLVQRSSPLLCRLQASAARGRSQRGSQRQTWRWCWSSPSTRPTSSPPASRSSSASACSVLVDSPRAPPDVEPTLRHSSPADEESQCFILCCLQVAPACFGNSLSLFIIHHHPYPFIHPFTCSRASIILVTSSSLSASFVAAFSAELLPILNLFTHSSRRALWEAYCEDDAEQHFSNLYFWRWPLMLCQV